MRSRILVACIISSTVFIVVFCLRQNGLLQSMELAAYDYQLRSQVIQKQRSSLIAMVKITEDDIQRLKEWPLSDHTLGMLLSRIANLGARVIGVDIYRDHPVPPGSVKFNQTIADLPNLIMVEKRGHDAGKLIAPPPALDGTDRIGFTDTVVDGDGYVRRGLLFMDDGENVFLSLSLRIALHYLSAEGIFPEQGSLDPTWMKLGEASYRPFESDDGGYTDADAGGYQYLLNFRDGASAFPTYTLQDIMDSSLPTTALDGKIVLVGVVADSVKDRFLTPISNKQNGQVGLPGVQIHAHAISQLINAARGGHQTISVIDGHWEILSSVLFAVLGVIAGLWIRRITFFVLTLIVGLVLVFYMSFITFAAGYWIPMVPAVLTWVLSGLLMAAYLSGYEHLQKRFLMDLFARLVSKDVAKEIWRQRDMFLQGGRLNPRKMPATILFTDLENFTPVAESLPPEQLIDWLNNYMDIMAGLVMQHGGVIDDYYGDAIKANFGVPVMRKNEAEIADDAARAINCALSMRKAMHKLNEECAEREFPPLRMRVGIATGPVIAGCLGSSQRMKYTTLGDTVNTAARLESYGKEVEWLESDDPLCRIMVTSNTTKQVADLFRHRFIGKLSLKGKAEKVAVYTIEQAKPIGQTGAHL